MRLVFPWTNTLPYVFMWAICVLTTLRLEWMSLLDCFWGEGVGLRCTPPLVGHFTKKGFLTQTSSCLDQMVDKSSYQRLHHLQKFQDPPLTCLKLTCHHINCRLISFNIKSISVHPLLWMNVMLDFICMIFAELWSTESKRKLQNDHLCLRRDSNQRPLALQPDTLTTRLSGQITTWD